MTPQPGASFGRYALIRPLGQGGMGEVWEAELRGPEGFRRRVALKLLRERSQDGSRRLVQEARLGALIAHPNVVATYDLGQAEGCWYVAMELVRGPSLSSMAARPQPPQTVLDVGLQVLAGLRHIHALTVDGRPAGLLHRDIKPGNLLLDPSGLVKIADLGIARFASQPDEPVGTPGYAPPEQLDAREDLRSDLFALGVVLHQLALGEAPFGRGLSSLPKLLRADEIVRAPAFGARLDALLPGLGAFLSRALRADPDARWPDAEAMADALRQLQRGLPATAAPAPRPLAQAEVPSSELPTLPLSQPSRPSLVGRGREVADLLARLEQHAVVTLVGPGGMGKTRVARAALERLRQPSIFVDLTEALSPEGVASALARALDLPLVEQDIQAQLGAALAARSASVWVLDNAEQVAPLVAQLVARWRDDAPEARFLITSRIPLGLRDEAVVPLGPLDLEDGVALFARRAPVTLSPAQLEQVRALVPALDGMPLAIELAAARTRLLSVEQIAQRLQDRFKLLSARDDQLSERHRSLLASLDGTWEVLPRDARATLEALAVFSGGVTLRAAERMLPSGEDDPWAIDRLEELASHGLLHRREDRFHLLVSIQDHATRKTHPQVRRRLEELHVSTFASLPSETPLRDLIEDLDNLVVATRRAIDQGRGREACDLAWLVWRVVEARGPTEVGLQLLSSAAEIAPPERRLDALVARAGATLHLARSEGLQEAVDAVLTHPDAREVDRCFFRARVALHRHKSVEAAALFERTVALADEAGDARVGVLARLALSGLWLLENRPECIDLVRTPPPGATRTQRKLLLASSVRNRAHLGYAVEDWEVEELREVPRTSEHLPTVLTVLQALHIAAIHAERHDEALEVARRVDRLAGTLGLLRSVGKCAYNLSVQLLEHGLPEEALEALDRAEAGYRRSGQLTDAASCNTMRARAFVVLDRLDEAEAAIRAAIRHNFPDGYWRGIPYAQLAEVLFEQGRREEAREVIREATPLLMGQMWYRVNGMMAEMAALDGRVEEVRAWLDGAEPDRHDRLTRIRRHALGAWLARREGDTTRVEADLAALDALVRPRTEGARVGPRLGLI
ncbi:MAG: protein kinase [Alphaproteobacteria bacterium]|nr:protein kinase [Alphaproteobacteria bacterium]